MIVGYELVDEGSSLSMLVLDPKSGVTGSCFALEGQVSYGAYAANDHKLTQYCIQPKSVAAEHPCTKASPLVDGYTVDEGGEPGFDTAEEAARAGFTEYNRLLKRLGRGATPGSLEVGNGLPEVVFATGKLRTLEPDVSGSGSPSVA